MKDVIYTLIIDDDSDDQEIFLMCINKISEEIVCRTARNGVEAIGLLESEKEYIPNYIFLDVNMPKMNGIECLRALKKIERLRETKFFMYSTTAETSVVDEIIDLGATDFLIKPAKTIVLREMLSKIFGLDSKKDGPNE